MAIINLPYGGNTFNSNHLIAHIKKTGRGYIIQGQTNSSLDKHPKPQSLDYWLRDNYAKNKNTKQAVNSVINALLKTGCFQEGRFTCPTSGRTCKGIRVVAGAKPRPIDAEGPPEADSE